MSIVGELKFGFMGWVRRLPNGQWKTVCTAASRYEAETEAGRWARAEGIQFADIVALPAGQRPRNAPEKIGRRRN